MNGASRSGEASAKSDDLESAVTDTVEAPSKRPARWGRRILVALIVVAVLLGGAELALRAIIPSVIAGAVRDGMGLASDHPVEVELGGSALLPALTGRVGEVQVTVADAEVFEGIRTDLYASADSMPFDPTTGEIRNAVVSVTIPSDSLGPLMALATDGLVDEGEVGNGLLELGTTMPLFGYDVHVTAGLAASINGDGDLVIDPMSVDAAGFSLTTEELRPLLGSAAASLLDTHTVCVRDRIPAGITLTGVDLRSTAFGGAATVTAKLDPNILSDPVMQEPGTCEAE